MMTLELWRALNMPPVLHPLFQRLSDERGRATWERIRFGLWAFTGLTTLFLLMAMPVVFFIIILMGPVIYALLNTLFYVSLWIVDIAGTVARELTHKTYDIQCLMPIGSLGINWIISTGRLHWKDGLVRSMTDIFAVVQLFLLTTMFIVVGMLVTPPGDEQVHLAHLLAIILSMIGFLYVEHIQATISGVCVALIAARQTRTVGDARLWALMCFLALQFGWYITVLVFSLLGVPFLVEFFHLEAVIFGLLIPPLVVLLALCVREGMIRLLWGRVLRGTNAENRDLKLLERYV
jgi:hypothetical protein